MKYRPRHAPLVPSIESALREAVGLLKDSLPADQQADVLHLLDHNEPGVALEALCTNLFEEDAVVPEAARELIAYAGNLMGMNPLLWEALNPATCPSLDTNAWWILTTGQPADIEHLVTLRRELEREIAAGHALYGEPFDVLARFSAADEVLLRLTGARFAIVHPTWSGKAEPQQWPTTLLCANVEEAQAEVDRIESLYISRRSTPAPSAKSPASGGPCAAGVRPSWPTSPPTERTTGPPRPSTASSSSTDDSPAATATATTTGYACSSQRVDSRPDPHRIGEEPPMETMTNGSGTPEVRPTCGAVTRTAWPRGARR